MRVAIYARVSTKDKGQSVEVQIPPLKEYIASRKWELYKIFTDDISATKNRPAFEQMIKDAKSRMFDALVVWKLDRFARSMQDFVLTVSELDSAGVRFICTTQGIDTDKGNAVNKLQMHIIASMAEFERSLISERVKAGMARGKSLGKKFGRSRTVVDVGKIIFLRGEGKSFSEIAKVLKISTTIAFSRYKEWKDKNAK